MAPAGSGAHRCTDGAAATPHQLFHREVNQVNPGAVQGDMAGYGALQAQEGRGHGCSLSVIMLATCTSMVKNIVKKCNFLNFSFNIESDGDEEFLKL